MTGSSISADDYPWNEVLKGNKKQTNNRQNKLIDKFAKIHNNEIVDKMELERKDTEPKMIQPAENVDTEHVERPPQPTANQAMDKKELNKQM